MTEDSSHMMFEEQRREDAEWLETKKSLEIPGD
jgi:hypothetical protein